MTPFQRWLSVLPTVNLRVLVSLGLSVFVILVTTVLMVLRVEVQQDVLSVVLIFLASMMGIDAVAYIGKRATAKPEVMDAEARIAQTGTFASVTVKETTKTNVTAPTTKPPVD